MLTYIKIFFENNQKLIKNFENIQILNIIEIVSFIIAIISIHFLWFYIGLISIYTMIVSFIISSTIQNRRCKSSKQELLFIKYLQDRHNMYIQCDQNKGQKKILRYQADGFVEDLNLVIEFNGCYYHGHDCDARYYNSEKLNQTINREIEIRAEGYNVIRIWECEWNNQDQNKLKEIDDNIKKLKSKQSYCIRIYNYIIFMIYHFTTIFVYFYEIIILSLRYIELCIKKSKRNYRD